MSKVGMSTACFYPGDTLESLKEVLSAEVKTVEIFMNSLSEIEKNGLSSFRAELSAHGAELVSFHPYTSAFESLLFFSEYTQRISDGIEVYKRFFDAAAYLGAKYFVFHGEKNVPTFSRGLSDDSVICEAYGRLIEESKKFGLVFTQENVNNHRSHSAEHILKLKRLVPELCFTFDMKQVYRARQDFKEIVSAMGEKLVHIHINDFGEHECCLPFTGYADLEGLSEQLSALGYSGDFILEVYRANFEGKEDLCACLSKLEKLFCR